MKQLLFITRNYPPLVGGMERLAMESVRALGEDWDLALLGPRGCESAFSGEATGVGYASAGRFLVEGWWQARSLALAHEFPIVVGGSGLAAPLVASAAHRAGSLTACFVHGLDLVARHPVYRGLCLPALRRMDLVIANSRNTARLAVEAGIAEDRIELLHPGVDMVVTSDAEPFLAGCPEARQRPLLLSVGRLLPRKGLADFVRHSLPKIVAAHPQALLVVVGGPARNALLKNGDEGARLAAAIGETGMDKHVLLAGQVSDALLDSLYAAARLMVFPVRDLPGDVEGFGMVALEAAAHGLPTAAFKAGGVADAVSDGVSGALIPPGEYGQMADRINAWLEGEWGSISADSCRGFAAGFNWSSYGESLRGLLQERMPPEQDSSS